jgi:2-methylcitrate dehydratase PrpD
MTATSLLARRAVESAGGGGSAHLRALTLGNVAAAIGDKGSAEQLIASLPFDEQRRPGDAAYLLALALHARTQDDFYPRGRVHVGAVTLAATLALADRAGDRLLGCLSAGYEVMCLVSEAYAPVAQQAGLRPSGVFGPLGAAASAGVAIGMGASEIAGAIGLAASMCAGTNQAWLSGTDEWLLEAGAAARAGVEAALFAEAGVSASPVALEGPAGWAKALFGDEDGSTLRPLLEADRSRTPDVAAKLYPVSGIAQVPTYLACEAHERLGTIVPDRIVLRISEGEAAYPGSSNTGPFPSRSAALMSLTFCVACGFVDGLVRIARLEAPNATDLEQLGSKIEIHPDADLDETEARLEVVAGGEELQFAGRGEDILRPSWEQLRSSPESLADRSEANLVKVVAVSAELAGDRPDARLLRALVQNG